MKTCVCLQHVAFEGPGYLHRILADLGYRIDRYVVPTDGLPISAGDFLLVMGGPMSVNDSDAWIAAETAFIESAVEAGTPFLGICLGMQALFERSEEAPELDGFGLFPGTVERFASDTRVPHMGWNDLTRTKQSRLLTGLPEHPYVYFAHSYYAPVNCATAASCTYTLPYTAVLEYENIHGVQFHPEKSGPTGLAIVKNFIELC